MATPIIIQLQEMATDRRQDITDLLRKALLVATKLKIADFREWIDCELNGYSNNEVPDYRIAYAEIKAFNPYRGYIPFLIQDERLYEQFTRVPIMDGIGSLAHLLERSDDGEGRLVVPFSDEVKLLLMQHQRVYMEPTRFIGASHIARIIEAIRTTILEWSLKLEEEGIVGDGISFSNEEKQRAAASQQIHIANFQGVLGNVSQSTISQNLTMTVRPGDFDSLRDYLQSQGVEDSDIAELQAAVEAESTPDPQSGFGPRVASWIGNMTAKAACGTWKAGAAIGIGGVGELLGNALWQFFSG